MFPVRFRQNLVDELVGGFVDENPSGSIPSGFTRDDSSSGNAGELDDEGGGSPDGES